MLEITEAQAAYLREHQLGVVPDGREQVIVSGTAELLDGRERDRYIMAIREHQGDPLPAD